jgi:hypothetical protein
MARSTPAEAKRDAAAGTAAQSKSDTEADRQTEAGTAAQSKPDTSADRQMEADRQTEAGTAAQSKPDTSAGAAVGPEPSGEGRGEATPLAMPVRSRSARGVQQQEHNDRVRALARRDGLQDLPLWLIREKYHAELTSVCSPPGWAHMAYGVSVLVSQ